jgi:DNA-directed RNA polymerase subunit RPC12/RpoP
MRIDKMYICPVCKKEFDVEEILVKHYLKCWKEKNLTHKSKPAPRSEDINTRTISDDIMNFFNKG